jgi:hypothetical protein
MRTSATWRIATIFVAGMAVFTPLHAYFAEWVRTSTQSVYNPKRPLTADFNGDGRADVVVQTGNTALRVMITNPDGTLGTPTILYQSDYLSSTILADVDGDGRKDVVTADVATDTLIVIPSNGDGTFGIPILTAIPIAPTEIAAGDFSGDGKLDLAIRSYSADILTIYAGDGAGHFSEVHREPLNNLPNQIAVGDVDGDGKLDILISDQQPAGHELRFGKGDGTFEAPISIFGSSTASSSAILADLNGDGRLEILTAEFDPNTVTVINNLSGRTFAAPLSYLVVPASLSPYGNPINLVVADFNDDGKPDVLVTLANVRALGTMFGNGDGTLGDVTYASVPQPGYYSYFFPGNLATGDFNGDGTISAALTGTNAVQVFKNASGVITLTITAVLTPTITVGQTASFIVNAATATGYIYPYNHPPPLPTGTITLKNGSDILGTGTFSGEYAYVTIDVPSLPAGTYSVTASFDGDASYRSTSSAAVTQHVITEATTATLTANPAGRELAYGEQLTVIGNVTSPIPGSLQGSYWLYTDGVRSQYSQSGPPPVYWNPFLSVGTHVFTLMYAGNATQPPGTSSPLTVVVHKARSITTVDNPPYLMQYGGTQPNVRVSLTGDPFGGVPGGNVSLMEGSTVLITTFADKRCCSGGITVEMTLPVLAPGIHYIRATYVGDETYLPSQSAPFQLRVLPAGTFVLDAQAGANWIQARGFFNAPPNTSYVVHRRVGSGAWTTSLQSTPFYSEFNPQQGTPYTYWIEALDSANNVIATSNADLAMIVAFTDDPVTATTPIKALHETEIVAAANGLRNLAGLPAFPAPANAGDVIRASHILAIRNAINEARVALGAAPAMFSTNVAAGSPVRIQDIQDLREAMR